MKDLVSVRYLVNDVEGSISWYQRMLGFELISNQAPAFADIKRGPLRLLLSGPKSSAGRAMADGERPVPGGWNRIQLIVDDLAVEKCGSKLLAPASGTRRSAPGGSQALIVDPSGNLVELFQPAPK